MDNTFAELFVNVTKEMSEAAPVEETVVEEEIDEVIDDSTEVEEEVEVEEETEEFEETEEVEEATIAEPEIKSEGMKEDKSYAQFTEMRKKNKELEEKTSEFSELAKQMGFENLDDLITKTKEALLSKKASEQNVPVEVLKKQQELEERLKKFEEQEKLTSYEAKKRDFDIITGNIISEAKLTQKQIDELAKGISSDFELDALINMSEQSITRIIKSYIPEDAKVQKMLEKKVKAKKEMPLTQSQSNNANIIDSQDEQINKFARYLAGK